MSQPNFELIYDQTIDNSPASRTRVPYFERKSEKTLDWTNKVRKKQRFRQNTSKRVDPVTKRMVEMTFAPFDEVIDWLVRVIKVEIISRDQNSEDNVDDVVTVKNPYLKMTSAFNSKVDPVTRAVCLGFITAGSYWPHAYPGLLEEVNKEWWYRRKKMYTEE